ncbi:MAG: phosphatase PAP2 family protein [Acidobacteriota bacterium]
MTESSRWNRQLGKILGEPYLFEWLALGSVAALFLFFLTQPVTTQPVGLALWLLKRMAILALLSTAVVVLVNAWKFFRSRDDRSRTLQSFEPRHASYWIDAGRIMVSFSLIQTTHLILKAYIPLINPGNFDPLLWRLDSLFGAGRDPVVIVLGLFSAPSVLRAFDFLYSTIYFLALWAGVIVFFAFLRGRSRIRFFNSFFVMWQLGLLLYVLLPSWGPVFTRPDLFQETLMHMPSTVVVQRQLFLETSSLVAGQYNVIIRFFGLAAFPSLHVAVFVLYSLWAPKVGRVWLWWNVILIPLILIGSMLTGYHYLIDGIVGALVAACAWVIGKRALADN